jgi:phosphopantetheinyl transferase
LPVPERLRAFYEAWTRREAFLKALGCGFGRPVNDDPAQVERFPLHALELDAGHVGAVAVSGHGWRVTARPWHWPERG